MTRKRPDPLDLSCLGSPTAGAAAEEPLYMLSSAQKLRRRVPVLRSAQQNTRYTRLKDKTKTPPKTAGFKVTTPKSAFATFSFASPSGWMKSAVDIIRTPKSTVQIFVDTFSPILSPALSPLASARPLLANRRKLLRLVLVVALAVILASLTSVFTHLALRNPTEKPKPTVPVSNATLKTMPKTTVPIPITVISKPIASSVPSKKTKWTEEFPVFDAMAFESGTPNIDNEKMKFLRDSFLPNVKAAHLRADDSRLVLWDTTDEDKYRLAVARNYAEGRTLATMYRAQADVVNYADYGGLHGDVSLRPSREAQSALRYVSAEMLQRESALQKQMHSSAKVVRPDENNALCAKNRDGQNVCNTGHLARRGDLCFAGADLFVNWEAQAKRTNGGDWLREAEKFISEFLANAAIFTDAKNAEMFVVTGTALDKNRLGNSLWTFDKKQEAVWKLPVDVIWKLIALKGYAPVVFWHRNDAPEVSSDTPAAFVSWLHSNDFYVKAVTESSDWTHTLLVRHLAEAYTVDDAAIVECFTEDNTKGSLVSLHKVYVKTLPVQSDDGEDKGKLKQDKALQKIQARKRDNAAIWRQRNADKAKANAQRDDTAN